MVHSFLLIGQSNMAGRGDFNEVKSIENKRIKVLRNGRWQDVFYPVNPDRQFSGVNLAESFADAYSKEHNADVGLIPWADGGTSLNQWKEGSLLFDNAIYQARLVSRTSTIAGILWHQGEADCDDELWPLYEEKLTMLICAFRKEAELFDIPFLLGGLGNFLKDCKFSPSMKNYRFVNDALRKVAVENSKVGFVSAEGLGANGDNLHFNAKALREFGLRYYAEFKKIEDKNRVFEEKENMDDAIRTEMEKL